MQNVRNLLRVKARIAGFLYLIIIVGGMFAELYVRDRLIVSGDAAATARNILAHEMLYRSGFAAGIIILMCAVPMAVILYQLLKPVSRTFAMLAILFNVVSIAVECVGLLFHFGPLIVLSGKGYLSTFRPEQLQTLAYTSLRLQSVSYNSSLAFFAFFCLFTGYLIFRSKFLPRLVGVLMALAGLCYLTNSFAAFLAPSIASHLIPWILVPCFIGEASLCLWLIVAGVNVPKWEQQAGT